MTKKVNILSVSGGKDSTAMWLWALEKNLDFEVVFADTGHEHPITYGYLEYLESKLGPIRRVKADFTERLEGKREHIKTHWKQEFLSGRPGKWVWTDKDNEANEDPPAQMPDNIFENYKRGNWRWEKALAPISEEEAEERIANALSVLQPSGNPFLDLCLWKGRFPSAMARFCTSELKLEPIETQVYKPIIDTGDEIVSIQALRRQESKKRAQLVEREQTIGIVYAYEVYRPLLDWTVEQVFAIHRTHGVMPNPLYEQGMGRVGCMPCIHAKKNELYEIARRYPEVIERVEEWERLVSIAARRGKSTFFNTGMGHGDGILEVVEWSKTGQGGKNYDLFKSTEDIPLCSSVYGLCE